MKLTNLLLSLFLLLMIPEALAAQSANCFSGLRISLRGSDATSLTFCQGDGVSNTYRFTANRLVQPVGYLVADENDIIVRVSYSNIMDLEGLPSGDLRVYGFYYLGKINDTTGENLNTAVLATLCYNLSDNFFPIQSIAPNGGTVSTLDGRASVFTCPEDGNPDVVSFATTSSDPFYTYVVTDDNNVILAMVEGDSFDFENAPPGICRVWGASFVGDFTAPTGENIQSADFGADCYDLSDNYVEIIRSVPDGGLIALSDGTTSATVCNNDEAADLLSFDFNTNSLAPYRFVLTDENNLIISLVDGNSLDFDGLAAGVCRVWGLSATGNIAANVGDDAATVALSDDCFDLSDNFIEITKKDTDGAEVQLTDGTTEALLCFNGSSDKILSLANTSSSIESYAYIITNEDDVVQYVVTDDSFDFSDEAMGTLRVWGVSYSGNLLVQEGDQLNSTALSDECFERSNNFISVVLQNVDGASVSLSDGSMETLICVQDGVDDILQLSNTSNTGENYAYLITDDNNVIITSSEDPNINLEDADPGVCRVWGLAYSGNLTITAGEDAATATLSDACFDLSNNFVTVVRKATEGGTLSLTDGATEALVCIADGLADLLTFISVGSSSEAFTFVVTDENNNILDFSETGEVDFENAPPGVCRVWGLAYTGNLTAGVGDNAAESALSDECFDLSDNFVSIFRKSVEGGSVSLADGSTEALICVADGSADSLTFTSSGNSGEAFIFVITDENNDVLDFSESGEIDFENAPPGVCRVWGLAYTGNLTASVGDNAAESALSDECFELSDNFVTIIRKATEGGSVSLADGATETLVCAGDGQADLLTFTLTGEVGEAFTFVITDENNNILNLSQNGEIDFEDAEAGVCRVWGLAYSGNIIATIGDNAAQTVLSDECFDLSDNFVTLTRKQVDGGNVSLDNGETQILVCVQDGIENIFTVNNDSQSDENYVYLITDENNIVLDIRTNPALNFERNAPGVCRVWGLSYSGNLTVEVGDDAAAGGLSDECFDLSDNFVAVTRKLTEGGSVSLENGSTEIYICVGDGNPDSLTFISNGSEGDSILFIITDDANNILAFSRNGIADFEGAEQGICRVWGLAYAGNIIANIGDNAAAVDLSDACFDLSDNFVTVDRRGLDGGTISLDDGGTEATICLDEIATDVLTFVMETAGLGNYVFVITDENNIVIDTSSSGVVDFSAAPPGVCRVWGLSYTGNLLVQTGDDAAAVALSDQCFDLSDNFVTLTRKDVDGASVLLEDGASETIVCANDENNGVLTFINTSAAGGNYAFLLTDTNNELLIPLSGNSIDISVANPGEYRVWGVSYTGNLIETTGNDVTQMDLSDECFDLSDDFVAIRLENVDGGSVSMPSGGRLRYICPGDGNPDTVQFVNTGSIADHYIYVITDENNVILAFNENDSMDFDGSGVGVCRVWGLAYTGNLSAQVGDTASAAVLTDECFDLSDDFITLIRETPDGGMVSTAAGDSIIYTCPGNTLPDLIDFDSTGTSNTPYGYIITNENNVVIGIMDGDSFDFENAPEGICRVWGLAYTGDLSVQLGDTASIAALSTDCFDLSDNFVEVVRQIPEGGRITFEDGSNRASICANEGDNPNTVRMTRTDATSGPYAYIILEEQEGEELPLIVGLALADTFDFTGFAQKTYMIRGLAYTGNLNISTGDSFDDDAPLSDDCFDLSRNAIRASTVIPVGGTILVEGFETNIINLCVGDGNSDTLRLTTDSPATEANSTKIITDGDGIFLTTLDDVTFDFENSIGGVFLIYNVSYTGIITLGPGDNINETPISSECADLSEPIVINANLVDGGRLLTLDNRTSVFVCTNDNIDDIFSFFNTSSAREADYAYVLAADGLILDVLDSTVLDVTDSRLKELQVWGVSYRGNFNPSIGNLVAEAAFSDSCFVLSDNPVDLFIDSPQGGMISTTDGDIDVALCPGVDETLLKFQTDSDSRLGYAYILTTNEDVIIRVIDGDSVEFADLPIGSYRIWAVSYAGDLTATPIANLFDINLSTSCFEVSANFIGATRFPAVDGGAVTTLTGEDVIYACPGNGLADLVVLFNSGGDAPSDDYKYLITDENNEVVIPSFEGDVIDFDPAAPGTYRIYGLSFNGTTNIQFGTNVATDMLADSCWELSSNFITIFNQTPEGGMVSTADSLTEISVIQGDEIADSVIFINMGASDSRYAYVATDENNVIVALTDENGLFDFEVIGSQPLRIWGLAYTGNIIANIGDDAASAALSDDCWDLSDNFVTVNVSMPENQQAQDTETDSPYITIDRIVPAPNPTDGRIRLQIEIQQPDLPESIIQIVNTNGQIVFEREISHVDGWHELEMEISNWRSGIYAVIVQNGRKTIAARFVKQE